MPKTTKHPIQIILNLISWLFIAAFGLTIAFTAVSNFNLLGSYNLLIVQSGSMEPSIMTGDVILIAKAPVYLQNDTITFNDSDGYITTHRIVQVATTPSGSFTTKGDANRVQDNDVVSLSQILGKVILVIPKLGYYISFSRSPLGIVLFIVIPGLIIVLDEVLKIIKSARKPTPL